MVRAFQYTHLVFLMNSLTFLSNRSTPHPIPLKSTPPSSQLCSKREFRVFPGKPSSPIQRVIILVVMVVVTVTRTRVGPRILMATTGL